MAKIKDNFIFPFKEILRGKLPIRTHDFIFLDNY